MALTANDRLLLAAIADRLIYGSKTTFYREDALDLLRLLPPRQRTLGRGGAQLHMAHSSSRVRGYAAGVGNVSVKGDGEIEYDGRGRHIVRAGQWKLYHEQNWFDRMKRSSAIEIEQMMMAVDADVRPRMASLHFVRAEPVRLEIGQFRLLGIPVWFNTELHVGYVRMVPWKTPIARPTTDPGEPMPAPIPHDGLRFAA